MDSPTGPLRLLIGVTGHLDLCDRHPDQLRAAVADALGLLGGPSRVPVVVLSALARGADRVVAGVALEMGCELVAVLPMPPDLYASSLIENSGDTPESIKEFWRLLGLAHNTCIVPPASSDPEAAYMAVGRDIARCSHILLAVWDGEGLEADGGTAWVVNERRGLHATGLPSEALPRGPIYHIAVHRQDQCPRSLPRLDGSWLDASPKAAGESLQEIHSQIETFNRDASRRFPDQPRPSIELFYKIADALAIRFRHLTGLAFGFIFAAVFLAAVSFAIYAHSEEHPLPFFGGYVVSLIVGGAVLAIAKLLDFQNKGQDYRALAEGLRVAWSWRLLGIADFVSSAYLPRQTGEAGWIRQALASFEHIACDDTTTSSPAMLFRTIKLWARPQLEYFERSARHLHARTKWFDGISKFCAAASVFFALVTFANTRLDTAPGNFVHTRLEAFFILSTATAVAGALLHNFVEKRAWHEHERRYAGMKALLTDVLARLDAVEHDEHSVLKPEETAKSVDLLRAVGQKALDENGEWLEIHRDRPLDIPHGG